MKKYLNIGHWTLGIGYFPALFLLLFAVSCQKNDPPGPDPATVFTLHFQNDFDLLQGQYAAFLSDADGRVRAFRWLPGNDTARLAVADARPDEHFDCTVVKIAVLSAPGTGLHDTTLTLTTYADVSDGAHIRLRDPNFRQSTDLTFRLTGLNTLDSIIVPDGLTFARPQASNNFQGHYRVLHSGRIWLRVLIDGETNWRYAWFDQVSGPALDTALDAGPLPAIAAPVATIALPLLTAWDYQVERIVQAGALQFLPVGDPIPIPGGIAPVFDRLDVFEPPGLPFNAGYRLRLSGYDAAAGEGYACDRTFTALPLEILAPDVDVQPTTLADSRQVAVGCIGPIDMLAFTRRRNGSPGIVWEALAAPENGAIVIHRLPDVPAELAALFPVLKNYAFHPGVQVRAEAYDLLQGYREALDQRISSDDPLWQMKSGFIARERVF